MNVDGTHLPIALTLASVLLVAWAGRRVLNEARERVPGGDGSGRSAASE